MDNLATHEGTHALDERKPFVVHLPVFADRANDKSLPRELLGLEFGCETAFFDQFESPEEALRGDAAGRLRRAFGVNDWMAVLIREKNVPTPALLFLFHRSDIVGAFRYSGYELFPPDMRLFEKPTGVTFKEPQPN